MSERPLDDLDLLESIFVLIDPEPDEKSKMLRFVKQNGLDVFLQALEFMNFTVATQTQLKHYWYFYNYLQMHVK